VKNNDYWYFCILFRFIFIFTSPDLKGHASFCLHFVFVVLPEGSCELLSSLCVCCLTLLTFYILMYPLKLLVQFVPLQNIVISSWLHHWYSYILNLYIFTNRKLFNINFIKEVKISQTNIQRALAKYYMFPTGYSYIWRYSLLWKDVQTLIYNCSLHE
jgi:hypothetical protein